jgi:phosphoribosylglycinamide formyltransferase 2
LFCTNRPPTRTGDYQESWQPATILDKDLYKDMAEKVTEALGGAGLLVLNFSLLMMAFIRTLPRPHDTGMVTFGTQNFNEFELHLRAILSLPIFEITLEKQVLCNCSF